MYVYSIIFSVAATVFIIDKIPDWVKIIMGVLFIVPVCALFFITGRKEGESMYREATRGTLTVIHDKTPVKIPAYKCIFHVVGFGAPLIVLTVIAAFAKAAFLRGIVSFILMPATVTFIGLGIIDFETVSLNLLYTYIPVIIIICGVFVFGYMKSVLLLKRRQGEIESELRSFDN